MSELPNISEIEADCLMEIFNIGVGHAAFLGHICFQSCQIAELTLARGVVHQADDADPV